MTPLLTWNTLWIYLGVGFAVFLIGSAIVRVFVKDERYDLDGDDVAPVAFIAFLWPLVVPLGAIAAVLYGVYLSLVYVLRAFKQAYLDNGCDND